MAKKEKRELSPEARKFRKFAFLLVIAAVIVGAIVSFATDGARWRVYDASYVTATTTHGALVTFDVQNTGREAGRPVCHVTFNAGGQHGSATATGNYVLKPHQEEGMVAILHVANSLAIPFGAAAKISCQEQ